ncbi:UNVERIFIED_CONTAM: hypothetical protein RMT77_014819 [Armadillidium vulgare]
MIRNYFKYSVFFFCGATMTFLLLVKQIFVDDTPTKSDDYERRSNEIFDQSIFLNILNKYRISSSNMKYEELRPNKKLQDENLKSFTYGTQHNRYLIEHIRDVIEPPSGLPYNLSNPTADDHSQYKQGEYLYNYFKDKHQIGGTFIEAGAFDGEGLSNTLILEQKLNWTGLLIEPNPYNYRSIPYKNRKCHSINCCISTTTRASKLKMSNNGLISSIIEPNTKNFYPPGKKPTGFFTANCYPLYSIMVAANLMTLDLLSIDLEGVEFRVLQTIPWHLVDIKSVIIEVDHMHKEKYFLTKYMEEKNYKLQYVFPIDYFFVKI